MITHGIFFYLAFTMIYYTIYTKNMYIIYKWMLKSSYIFPSVFLFVYLFSYFCLFIYYFISFIWDVCILWSIGYLDFFYFHGYFTERKVWRYQMGPEMVNGRGWYSKWVTRNGKWKRVVYQMGNLKRKMEEGGTI